MSPHATLDGNDAAARIAYALSEVVGIYPITPASPMGELADAWSNQRRPNLWGLVPDVVEMQSEGGAAGAVHGALQAGALSTTFTASQGLLLMLPNMFKIAGELTPTVFHIAARSIATHALSIFGDHSDVMAARSTGFAMLAAASVQEAQDLALVAHAATLRCRIPFLHFFDGFRTSHELVKIELIDDAVIGEMIDDQLVAAHRLRALNPHRPVLRGSAQNPDVFFQAREASNQFFLDTPGIVQTEMDRLHRLTGRRYRLFDYVGDPQAERVAVMMGSGVGAMVEAVEHLVAEGEKVGVVVVRLYRPFDVEAFRSVVPDTARVLTVLDRCKEPGAVGEPLYQDVVAAVAETGGGLEVIGGRYGLSSKEFTPPMAAAVLAEASSATPKRHFTVGIEDDLTHLSLDYSSEWPSDEQVFEAVFYGLGADGTVGANKSTVKIVGDGTDLHVQGYFVYDSKKSGSQTVSHLRFGPRPILSTYLIDAPDFVACHQWSLLDQLYLLERAKQGAIFLLNSPYGADEVWARLPESVRQAIVERKIRLWVVDADRIARDAGLGGRVNTVLQTCFFALTDLMDTEEAIEGIRKAVSTTYGKRGEVVVRRNLAAIDQARLGLVEVQIPDVAERPVTPVTSPLDSAPDFVRQVTFKMMAGRGDSLPVSALPADGTFPTGTTRWEKRSIAHEIPIWDPEICIDCARCALVCPHAAIRVKVFKEEDRPDLLPAKQATGREFPGHLLTIQVAPDDCTGCGVCVDICPAKSKEEVRHKAINMEPKNAHLEVERARWDAFLSVPEVDRTSLDLSTIKGSQVAQPLFEFSGACAGCGETPYLKLISQQFGSRTLIANATGCSSIYGGNLPTTPWSVDSNGYGPAWSNSLFEDNAEFGLGMRLALDQLEEEARRLVTDLAPQLGDLAAGLLDADQSDEAGVAAQRERVRRLKEIVADLDTGLARRLEAVADHLVKTVVWIVGGDGWAYDIGFGGLDHIFASGRNVNILVLDTEVYSNTGGQASKATPRAAVAKYASGGKTTGKKDLGQIAMSYGNVYVGQVAMGANMTQTVRTFMEAVAHPGVSLIIAYSPCIAHGIEMSTQMSHQKEAAETGYWPLYRYDPARETEGLPGLRLDSRKPTIPFVDFARKEARFAVLAKSNPDQAAALLDRAQKDIDDRWHLYEQMVNVHRTAEYGEVENDG